MTSEFIEVKCPGCATVIIVRRRDGNVVEVRKPIVEESSGDRFIDAENKIRGEKDAIQKKFEAAKEREKGKMDRLNALFKENLDRVKSEGPVTKPHNPLDND